MLGNNQMEIESVLPPLPVDPDTSILANEVVLENIRNDRQERPILISDSTPIKVSKKRKLADQQKVENDEESLEKSKFKLNFRVFIKNLLQ